MWKKRKKLQLISAIIVAIIFLVLYKIQPFMFMNNDDRFVQEIASGMFTGSIESHLILPGGLFGYAIMGLHLLIPDMGWFGIVQTVYLAMSLWVILFCSLMYCKTKLQSLGITVLVCLLYSVTFLRATVYMTWTTTAAILAAAAVFHYACMPKGLTTKKAFRYNILTYCMVFMSFQLRDNALLMMLPLAGVVGLYKFIVEDHKQEIKKYILVVLPVLASVFISIATTNIVYQSDEWQASNAFYDARISLVDYEGYPDYEGNEELYESLGISEELYIGMSTKYLLLFADVDAADLEQLVERRDEIYNESNSTWSRLKEAVVFTLARVALDDTYILPFATVVAYLVVLGILCLMKKKEQILYLLALWLAHAFTWILLLYLGRFPAQVVYPLYAAEHFMLLAVLLNAGICTELKACNRLVKLGCVSLASVYLLGGMKITASALDVAGEANAYFEALPVFHEYCSSHSENIYLVDDTSLTYFKAPAIEIQAIAYENYIPLGGWVSHSPHIDQKLINSGIEDAEEALMTMDNCYVVFNSNEYFDQSYLWNYLDTKYDYTYEVVDTVVCSEAVSFDIIQVTLMD